MFLFFSFFFYLTVPIKRFVAVANNTWRMIKIFKLTLITIFNHKSFTIVKKKLSHLSVQNFSQFYPHHARHIEKLRTKLNIFSSCHVKLSPTFLTCAPRYVSLILGYGASIFKKIKGYIDERVLHFQQDEHSAHWVT